MSAIKTLRLSSYSTESGASTSRCVPAPRIIGKAEQAKEAPHDVVPEDLPRYPTVSPLVLSGFPCEPHCNAPKVCTLMVTSYHNLNCSFPSLLLSTSLSPLRVVRKDSRRQHFKTLKHWRLLRSPWLTSPSPTFDAPISEILNCAVSGRIGVPAQL